MINLKRIILALLTIVMIVGIGVTMNINVNATSIYQEWSAIFDPVYYAAKYPDAASYANGDYDLLFDYFKQVGIPRKDQANEEFNVDIYIRNYPELSREYGTNYMMYYVHYQQYGKALGYNAKSVFTAEQLAAMKDVSSEEIVNFYDRSVFIGDSIMVGFRNYASTTPGSFMGKSKFLACVSYSLLHALNPVSRDGLQPIYNGKKMNVWDAIPGMGVDKVFIMFGTNDLTYTRADIYVEKHKTLIAKIKEKNPNVQIFIIGMTPVYAGSERGCLNNSNIRWVNEYLLGKQKAWGFTYVNLYENVVDGRGNFRAEYSSDRYVHHNAKCYAEAWEPTLKSVAIHAIAESR